MTAELDGAPLAGAEVVLEPISLTTVTDAEGHYAFLSVPADGSSMVYVIEVHRAGFESGSRQIVAVEGETLTVDISLWAMPPVTESDIVVSSTSLDEVMCIGEGDELGYEVAIANEGAALETGVVLHDTLTDGFGGDLTAADIVVDREAFPDAVVVVNADGRSFRVELDLLPPMPSTVVYTVGLPAATPLGDYCNAVSAVGAGGALLARDRNCIVSTLAIDIRLENEDGAIAGGTFTALPDTFHVGDGGTLRPEALAFRVTVTNDHCFAIENVRLTSTVGALSNAVRFRAVLPGFPDQGTIGSSSADGFVWDVGILAPGERVEIQVRAEAVQAADDVHRVALTAAEFAGEQVNEEPIVILP